MSAIYIREGETITVINSGQTTIKYKDVIDINSRIVVAAADIAAGASGSATTEGVFEVPAINTAAFAQGDEVYWDASAGKLTNVSGDLTRAGWCVDAKLETATTAKIKID